MNTERFLEEQAKRRAKEVERAQSSKERSKIPFLKVGEGNHTIRIIPKGNVQQGLPYREVLTHTVRVGRNWHYMACYDWLFSHEGAKEATIKPLMEMGQLFEHDILAFKKFGCPACSARDVLYKGGEDKNVYQSFNRRLTAYWNVLLKSPKTEQCEQGNIYVWSCSQTHHKKITGIVEMYLVDEATGKPLPKEERIDVLSTRNGYDWRLTATGKDNNRRYDINPIAKARPIGEVNEGQQPMDLLVVLAENVVPYGQMCQVIRQAQGTLLASYGFKYGVVMPDDKPKNNSFDDDEDELEVKQTKANVKTNPASVEWDDSDEENPKPKKPSNDLKKPKKVEEEPIPWDDPEDEAEEVKEDESEGDTSFNFWDED